MTEFTINALSALLGMDRRTLGDRFRDVEPARTEGRSKLYTLLQVITVMAADFLPAGDIDLNEAKRRRELALAQLAELDLHERQGELLPADDVAATWAAMISNARSRLLAIPVKGAPLLQGVTDLAAANEILKRLVYEALRELSETNFGLPEHEQAA